MKTAIVFFIVCGACRLAAAPPGDSPNWREVRVDASWRDRPARAIVEDLARDAGLRVMLDDAVARRLDAAHVTLLARKQPLAALLRRIGELTDTDFVLVSGRVVAYEHGRVPALLIVANELEAAPQTPLAGDATLTSPKQDCEWVDLTVSAMAAEMSRAFGVPVSISDAFQGRQELVSFSVTNASLDDAVREVCKQLDCPFGWFDGGIVIGRAGPAVPARTVSTSEKVASPPARPLQLAGENLTWRELGHLTGTRCGRDVILPDARQDRSLGRLWADGDALDVMVARAMWEPSRLSVDVTAEGLVLIPAEDEVSPEP